MATRTPDPTLQQLLDNLDVVGFYSAQIPALKVNGHLNVKVDCPFGCGGGLSFSVEREKGVYFCHRCGVKGSAWGFLKQQGLGPAQIRSTLMDFQLGGSFREPTTKGTKMAKPPLGPIVKTYDYADEAGAFLFQVTRHDPKDFRQRHKGPDGHWIDNIKGVRRVLYGLPGLIDAVKHGWTIYIVEGEKDADAINGIDSGGEFFATTAPMGAKAKWLPEYTPFLAGANVVLVADKGDKGDVGVQRALDVRAHVQPVARSVRIVQAKTGKDAFDHIAAAHGLADFVEMPEPGQPESDTFTWGRLDIREAINSKPKPIEWIAAGLCAKGEAVVLTASTGLGKTYITLQLAIDAAVGRPVLGLYDVPRPMKVLWIDEEMGIEMLNDRLTRQVAGSNLDERELELLHANLDIRYQQGLSLGDDEQFAIYDRTLREGRYDFVVMDSMVALTTGNENVADDVRAFYKRCIAPYKGSLGTAFWILAHPPKPHKDAAPGAQHDPRGSGDKVNAVDRSFYLELDSETITEDSFVLKVILNRRKMRQGGSVTGQLIVIDGPEAKPVHVHSLGTLGGEKAAQELSKINTCAQDMLVKLRGATTRMLYQPKLNEELIALGYDKRNHIVPARNMLVNQGIVKVLPRIRGAPEGTGAWLQLTSKADD